MKTNYPNLTKSINDFKEYLGDKYLFLPVAQEAEIKKYEDSYDIIIPQEYRWFLLKIANGIVSKDDWGFNLINQLELEKIDIKHYSYNYSTPFRLTTKTKFHSPEDDEDYYEDDYPHQIIYDETENYENCSYGYISLVGYGCGTYAFIVVNGEEYGNLWIHDIPSNDEVYPEFDKAKKKRRLKFIDWICQQMDHQVQLYLYHNQLKQNSLAEKRRREINIYLQEKEQRKKINQERRKNILEGLTKILAWFLAIALIVNWIKQILS